jgi:hypothetical protein
MLRHAPFFNPQSRQAEEGGGRDRCGRKEARYAGHYQAIPANWPIAAK